MKKVRTVVARRINVIVNSKNTGWAKIKDASTGQVLHTGLPGYIRRVARSRYNQKVNI